MKRLVAPVLAALVAAFLLPALALAQVQSGGSSPQVPYTAPTGQFVTGLNGAGQFQSSRPTGGLPRGHLRAWFPFNSGGGLKAINTGGTAAPLWMALEVPDDLSAARLIFNNSGTNAYSVTDFAVSSSSQLGVPGQSSPYVGVTAFDAAGSALTRWSIGSFGQGGVNSTPAEYGMPGIPANPAAIATVASASAGATSLTVSNVSGTIAQGQTIAITNPSNAFAQPMRVASVSGSTVNLDGATLTALTNATVYFLPLGITVAAAANPPIDTLVYSDWIEVYPLDRRDGPLTGCTNASGCTAKDSLGLLPANATATANGDNQTITLSTPLTQGIPANDNIRFCQAQTVNGALTPSNTLNFAATSGAAVGMAVIINAVSPTGAPAVQRTTVSGVTGTTLTTTDMLAPGTAPMGNGVQVTLDTTLTVTGPVISGQTVIPVAATNVPLASLSSGANAYGAYSTPIPGSATATVNSGAATVTLSQATTAAFTTGETLHLTLALNTNQAVTSVGQLKFNGAANVLPGFTVEGVGWPSGAYLFPQWTFTSPPPWGVTLPPTQAISDGAAVQICSTPIPTSAFAAANTNTLSFKTTLYKNRLLLVRVNFAGNPAYNNYWAGNQGQNAAWNADGLPNNMGGFCIGGTDSVLNIANYNDAANQCIENQFFPVWAVELLSPSKGITIATIGDSRFGGNGGSNQNSETYVARAAAQLSSAALPISSINCGWGAGTSAMYMPNCEALLRDIRPEIVMIEGTPNNDANTTQAFAGHMAKVTAKLSEVNAAGGIGVVVTSPPVQVYGFSAGNSTIETLREYFNAQWVAKAASTPVFDWSAVLIDPAHANYMNPAYSWDGVHPNPAGQIASIAPFLTAIMKWMP